MSTTTLTVLSIVDIVLLVAGLAVYLFWVGSLLARIATNLEGAADIIRGINADAVKIGPGVGHINSTGNTVAEALPLLYGMAEGIVTGATYTPSTEARPPARPAAGRRRSRALQMVGLRPTDVGAGGPGH